MSCMRGIKCQDNGLGTNLTAMFMYTNAGRCKDAERVGGLSEAIFAHSRHKGSLFP
jgi:hypothetical protein